MRYPKGKNYCINRNDLNQYKLQIKLIQCPKCGRVGFLIGHGFLRGYAEMGQDMIIRGRRFFCSNRHRRQGCGHTFSVLLADFLRGFMVTTQTLWKYLQAVSDGSSRHAAWQQIGCGFSLQSAYRLWNKLRKAQAHIRSLLCRQRPPPQSNTSEPLCQLSAHLCFVFPSSSCPFACFQSYFQTPLFG